MIVNNVVSELPDTVAHFQQLTVRFHWYLQILLNISINLATGVVIILLFARSVHSKYVVFDVAFSIVISIDEALISFDYYADDVCKHNLMMIVCICHDRHSCVCHFQRWRSATQRANVCFLPPTIRRGPGEPGTAHIQIAPSPTCSRLSADAAACRPMQPRRPMQLMYLTSRASLVTHCAAMTRGKVTRFVTKPALHSASSSTHPIVFTDTALPMS